VLPGRYGVFWYRSAFTPEARPERHFGLIRFNMADFKTEAWLNGAYLGSHEGGEEPFVFDAGSERGEGNGEISGLSFQSAFPWAYIWDVL
jgi:beta-galactosidase/beta-glucuronidase